MSDQAAEFDRAAFHWHTEAELDDGFEVKVTLDTSSGEKANGPWGLIVDEPPASGGSGSGPSPVNLALGALAACTAVTVAGVARRRKMGVERLRVEVESNRFFGSKAEAEAAAESGAPVGRRTALKRIVVTGDVTDEDLKVIARAARHCPVSRMFNGGPLVFEEEVVRDR